MHFAAKLHQRLSGALHHQAAAIRIGPARFVTGVVDFTPAIDTFEMPAGPPGSPAPPTAALGSVRRAVP